MYEIIAENFTPVLFRNDPFFWETGLKAAEYNGRRELSAGGFLMLNREHLYREKHPESFLEYIMADRHALHLAYGPFCDYDHHCFPFSNLLKLGLSGILARLREGRRKNTCPDRDDFYTAAEKGLNSVQKIILKFAQAAEQRKNATEDPADRTHWERIEQTALKLSQDPPGTFFEGLASLRFFYEIGNIMDGIGMSVLGSPDRQLIRLYRADLQAGRLTREEAYDLICRFMLQVDCKLDSSRPLDKQYNAGEQGDTLILGGLDEAGNPVDNELTEMFLRAHEELQLIYPKIQFRTSRRTPAELFHLVARPYLAGRNVIGLLNDEVLIPALLKNGKTPHDASGYVAGGCWEVIAEGTEHSEGANCYFSLGRAMDLTIHHDPELLKELGLDFKQPDSASSFQEFLDCCMDNVKTALKKMLETIAECGSVWPEVNPCPFFSACLDTCAETGLDYTQGGAKYSPHSVPLTGFAIWIDSLESVRKICFENREASLQEMLTAVRNNWKGFEQLRKKVLSLPHWGGGNPAVRELAGEILRELHQFITSFRNERGGPFQCGLYSYSDIVFWAKQTRATPDGRKDGDFLAQGITPSRMHHDSITSVLKDAASLPLEDFPANSVLNLNLSRNGLTEDALVALLRCWTEIKASGMLQLNCISREELEDADRNPGSHEGLIVRLYGYSARYVTLDADRRREFKERNLF